MATYKNKKIDSSFYLSKPRFGLIPKIIIAVIVISFVLVIFSIINVILSDPERVTKNKIHDLATNYYENFLYEQMEKSGNLQDFNKTMDKLSETGFSTVYLRQLYYFGSQNHLDSVNYLKSRCNENKTAVKFYPEYPYDKTSYRIDYIYSCDF